MSTERSRRKKWAEALKALGCDSTTDLRDVGNAILRVCRERDEAVQRDEAFRAEIAELGMRGYR